MSLTPIAITALRHSAFYSPLLYLVVALHETFFFTLSLLLCSSKLMFVQSSSQPPHKHIFNHPNLRYQTFSFKFDSSSSPSHPKHPIFSLQVHHPQRVVGKGRIEAQLCSTDTTLSHGGGAGVRRVFVSGRKFSEGGQVYQGVLVGMMG